MKTIPLVLRMAAFAAAISCSSQLTCGATTYYWDTITTGLWSTGANWSNNAVSGGTTGVVPTSTDSVFFNQSSVNGAETVQLSADATVSGLTFANTGTTVLDSDSATPRTLNLVNNTGLIINSGAGAVTIGDATNILNVTLAASENWTNNSSNTLNVVSGITSAATSGTTTLTFAAGNAAVSGVIGNGSTGGAFAISKNSAASTLTLTGANTFTGGVTISVGTVNVGSAENAGISGPLGVGGTISFGASAGSSVLQYSAANNYDYSSRFSTAASQAITIDTNSQNVTFASNLTSSGGSLTKNGAGALTLTGVNTYTAGTTLSAGQLNINNASAIGTGAVTLNVAGAIIDNTSGSAITLSTNNAVTIGAGFTFGGTKNLNFGTGAVTNSSNTTTITLNGVNSNVTFGGVVTNNGSGTNQSFTVNGAGNTLTLGGYTSINKTGGKSWLLGGSGNVNVTGVISNGTTTTGVAVTYAGTGTLTLSGNNTYTGITTLTSGRLNLGNANALSSGTLALGTTTSLDNVSGNDMTLTGNNPITASSSTLTFVGSNSLNLGTGGLAITNSATFNVNANTLTLGGPITGAFGFTKGGAGTLVLSGANTNSIFTANAGTLQFAKEVSLFNNTTSSWTTAKLTVAAGATLALGVGDSASGYFDSTALDTFRDASHMGASTTTTGFKSSANIGFDTTNATSGTFTYASNITNFGSSATNGLVKLGTGTLVLSGTNTYTGATTVSNGTLTVSGSIASSATTVSSGATLALSGSGIAGAVTVNSGTFQLGTAGTAGAVTINGGTFGGVGTVNSLAFTGTSVFGPGNSPGTVTIANGGSLTLSSGTTSTFQFTDSGFGVGTFDLVTTPSTGTGTIAGTLNLDFTGTGYTAGSSVTFINLSSITGTFSTVNVTGLSGLLATVNYNNGAGDVSVSLTAIPEPSTYAAIFGLAILGLAVLRRRRRA